MTDPFLDIVGLLKPAATIWGGGFDAHGQWSVSFRQRNDLLFCWVERGDCLLIRHDEDPIRMREGDFALILTSSPFRLASDEVAPSIDIEEAISEADGARLGFGDGSHSAVTLHAGKFVFASANQDLLSSLLPPFVHITAEDEAYGRVRTLLSFNEAESRRPRPGSRFMIIRMMELVLVEILRTQAFPSKSGMGGLLAGLADAVISRALNAMHADVAHDWTVHSLATLCGASRSAFASRFRRVVGVSPMEYLLRYRMALAKDALSVTNATVGEIAFAIGFQSSSAFSTSFSRMIGCSPTKFASRIQNESVPLGDGTDLEKARDF